MKIGLIILGCVLLIAIGMVVKQPEDKVVFLDIGQGDSILIQNKTAQVLIDGGKGMTVLSRLAEEMPWFDRKIQVVIATHPDQDHLEGLLHVIERYEVGLVLLPQMAHTTRLQEEWLKKLQRAVEEKEVAYRFAWRGQKINVSDVSIEVLGPFSNEEGNIVAKGSKTNNGAILSRVDFGEMSFLLTSDAEHAVEKMLVEETSPSLLDVDVLKAGHHGSKTSTGNELLAAASPEAVVISVGDKNRYGHPHPIVVDRLKNFRTLRTDELGSIRWVRNKEQWLLTCSRECASLD